ncbi:MAG: TetR/AcrR family transcriptional regulator [Desulfovibrionaceae bacterium]|nr:TetR/AcrR family transcriptional regulator [Desulfovibrionaceae bacterium]
MSSLRQQKKEQTRNTLLENGAREIVRVGLAQISIRHICRLSGYTLGAFYASFANREAFLLAVMDSFTGKIFASIHELVEKTVQEGISNCRQNLEAWIAKMHEDRLYSELLCEFAIHARHDERFRETFSRFMVSWWQNMTQAVTLLCNGLKLTPKEPFSTLAMHLSAMWLGLTLQEPLQGAFKEAQPPTFFEDIDRILDAAERHSS